ncbi:MAG: HAD family hydrolase [Brevinemataceae bacterium]
MLRLAVYDFDRTVFNGDTGIEVLKYLLKHYPKTRKAIPKMILSIVRYFLRLDSQLTLKENTYDLIKYFTKTEWKEFIETFWMTHSKNLFPQVVTQIELDQKEGLTACIISASPEIMLFPIIHKLKVSFLIGTRFQSTSNFMSSKIIGLNCKNYEKVSRLEEFMKQHYPDQAYSIEKMYSDSLHDLPLFEIAKQQITVNADGSMRLGLPKKNNNL